MKSDENPKILNVKLGYKGKEYVIKMEFEQDYDDDAAFYLFEDGNYSCDCNLSQFIQNQCDENFPKLSCGETIELIEMFWGNKI